MTATPLVHVVDDNSDIRLSLQMLLESVAIESRTYPDADAFLENYKEDPTRPEVLLLDVRMPGMSGMALLERLHLEYPILPVIMITGHGDIDMAVRAMKLGAMDFITKPFGSQLLLDRIQEVLRRAEEAPVSAVNAEEAAMRLGALTTREREIFEFVVSGATNKAIALDLGISIRTVEAHRASIMEKTKAKTLVDLVMLSVGLKGTHSWTPSN